MSNAEARRSLGLQAFETATRFTGEFEEMNEQKNESVKDHSNKANLADTDTASPVSNSNSNNGTDMEIFGASAFAKLP